MSVIREDRVITIGEERGARGADGTSSRLVILEQTNENGASIIAAPQGAAPATSDDLYAMRVEYPFTAGVMTLEITGLTSGDPRQVRWPGTDDGVTPGPITVGDWVVFGQRADGYYQLLLPARPGDAASAAALVPSEIAPDATYWTWTPGEEVVGVGEDQVFFGVAPAAHAGSVLYVRVVGINDAEERPVRLADGVTPVSTTDVPAGASVAIRYNATTGRFQLIWPPISAAAASPIVMLDQVSRVNNIVQFEPQAGFDLPNNTGYGVLMGARLSGAPSGGWAFGIEGITTDPLELRYPDDTAVESDRIGNGVFAFWTRNAATNRYNLLAVWDADGVKPSSGAAASDPTLSQFYAAANGRIYAQASFGK